jgi:hypothetical protein
MSLEQGQTPSHPRTLAKILITRVPRIRELGVAAGSNFAQLAHQILGLRASDRPTELLINSMRYNPRRVL